MKDQKEFYGFNVFNIISTFVRSLIEIFISLYLFKKGFNLKSIVLFYVLANFIAIPISYVFALIGEKTRYVYVMLFSYVCFIGLQLILKKVFLSNWYILLIAFIYSLYRRGYWIARRYYMTNFMPRKRSSFWFGIISASGQIAKILAGYAGAYIFSGSSLFMVTSVASVLLLVSIIPIFKMKYDKKPVKIELIKNMKKYDKGNFLTFSFFELDDLLSYLFPIYIALYVNSSYMLAGNLNAISNFAIIIFILVYGKLINNKRNFMILSTILVIICSLLKLTVTSYLIMIVYFVDGLVLKMQNQSSQKIYFENNNGIDKTHYTLLYDFVECFMRGFVGSILLFMSDIKVMILTVLLIITILMGIYMLYISSINKKTVNS